jgi:glycosyltransferase involved in cell wall biosynthesis
LQESADEIVVLVDSESSDRTLEIAKSFSHVKCEAIRWMGYAKTKQHAISICSFDWILWIDADEVVTKELSKEINAIKNLSPEVAAYSFPRKAFFLGRWIKHSGWYPGRVTRLFNKHKVKFSNNNVHEYLETEGETGKLNSDLEHYTDPNIQHYFHKFNRYTTLAAEELVKSGKSLTLFDILLRPPAIFLKMYFVKCGFLDGLQGFILAVFSSAYVFTKYCKFWELKNKG